MPQNIRDLIGRIVVVRTMRMRRRVFIGCLLRVTNKTITLRIWNGFTFVNVTIQRRQIRDVFLFPCGPIGGRFAVVRLRSGGFLIGCLLTTAPSNMISLSIFAGDRRFQTIQIPRSSISRIIDFPCR